MHSGVPDARERPALTAFTLTCGRLLWVSRMEFLQVFLKLECFFKPVISPLDSIFLQSLGFPIFSIVRNIQLLGWAKLHIQRSRVCAVMNFYPPLFVHYKQAHLRHELMGVNFTQELWNETEGFSSCTAMGPVLLLSSSRHFSTRLHVMARKSLLPSTITHLTLV